MGEVSVDWLLEVLVSPPPETVTVLLAVVAVEDTLTEIEIIGRKVLPGAESSRVQVNVLSVQFQPEPVMAVAVSSDDSLSVTVMVPLVAPLATLLTWMV